MMLLTHLVSIKKTLASPPHIQKTRIQFDISPLI
jgi:hypothetical protein